MGSIGDCFDNAVVESFWARIQVELLNRRRWRTRVELANAIFEHLEINRQRRHSSLGMLTPIEFEKMYAYPFGSGMKSNQRTPRNRGNINVSMRPRAFQSRSTGHIPFLRVPGAFGRPKQAWTVEPSLNQTRLGPERGDR
jgi:hypothetical protein